MLWHRIYENKNQKIIMAKNLYIDASHPSETRVVLKNNENIEGMALINIHIREIPTCHGQKCWCQK